MSSEPAKFPKEVKIAREPIADIVKECEQLLVDAKSGKIRSLAYAIVTAGTLTEDHRESTWYSAETYTLFAMTYSIHHLAYRWDHEIGFGAP